MGFILIADDDADDILLLKSAFNETDKVEIKSVENGEEVLEFLAGTEIIPDLIILDLNMPMKGGLSTLKEIRRSKKLKSIPVIIFSTSNYERDISSAYESGANSYIRKPMSYQELREITHSVNVYWFKTVLLN